MTTLNVQPGADQFNAGAGWTGLLFSKTARDELVPNPGGGQANATLLTCVFNRVVTVTNPGDSVTLPLWVNADGSINLVSFVPTVLQCGSASNLDPNLGFGKGLSGFV
jgi:hypothetical protein